MFLSFGLDALGVSLSSLTAFYLFDDGVCLRSTYSVSRAIFFDAQHLNIELMKTIV